MLALALSFAFFLFAAFVGRALLALSGWRGGILRGWLLAPATGLSVLVLGTMTFNQLGLPIRAFAWPLALGLLAASAGIFVWRRPLFPTRALLPFFGVALFSLIWTGWPMLRFNFSWLSYVNDDYVNYCLAAERFRDFGFWRVPTMEELAGTDISQNYWFMHVPGLMRFGSEHTLAWTSAMTGVRALGIFMPVIVGLGLIQLFAAAALVLHRGRWRRHALIAAALLTVSPLFMRGTLYQLIAQVGGLAILLAATALLTERLPRTWRRIIPPAIVLAVLGSGLAIYYPEVTPFAVLTAGVVGLIEWIRNRAFPLSRLGLVISGIIGVVLLLRFNILSYFFTISNQVASGFHSVDLSLSLFPYFLIPTGLANLFGLMPLALNFAEPFTSLSIIAGAIALITALAFAVRESIRPTPIAVLLLVQVGLALRLFSSGNDFGLYKVAMFMQPALAGALAYALVKLPSARFTAPFAVVLIAACCAPTALHYTILSQGETAGGITEAKLASVLGPTAPEVPGQTRLLADINNVVAAKLAAAALRGHDLRFLSRDYYQQAPIEYNRLGNVLVRLHPRFSDFTLTGEMLAQREENTIRTHSLFQTSFRAPALAFAPAPQPDGYLILHEALGLFNKLRIPAAAQPETFFKYLPAAQTRNHLVFVHSGRGNHYFLGDRQRIALYQQEADPYTSKQDIAGLGRFLLLRVEQPDAEFYLRIAASKTFMGKGRTAWSPGSKVLGETEMPLPFPGNGAVNRIVGPIRPVYRDGAAYIAIDLNETPMQFQSERSGLQALYNTVVPLDSRKLVAYGRDISALSAAELAALPRPTKLTRFPDDLVYARGLEFAGIYEDGWLSPRSEFVLGGGGPQAWARVRGYVPALPDNALGSGTLTFSLPSGPVEVPAAVGSFDWLLPVGAPGTTAKLALAFSQSASLPNRDDRPVGGRLEYLEVFPSLPTYTFDFSQPTSARLASTGIDQDGWMARQATIQLPPFEQEHDLVLTFEYPGWSDTKATTLRAFWPGEKQARQLTLTPGVAATMRVRVPASNQPRTLRLEASNDFMLVAPDLRRRSGRLLQVEIQPRTRL